MTAIELHLIRPIVLVPTPAARDQLRRLNMPDPREFVVEIDRLVRGNGLPGRLDDRRRNAAIYTRRAVGYMSPSKRGDVYVLHRVVPRTFAEEARLARAALLIRSRLAVGIAVRIEDVGPGFDAQWETVLQKWDEVTRPSQPTMPPQHREFLDRVSEIIEAGRTIDLARHQAKGGTPFRRVATTSEVRHSARPVYLFETAGTTAVEPNSLVYIKDEPFIRGRVVRATPGGVTVRLDEVVDFAVIPQQGILCQLNSDSAYDAQQNAVSMIRKGQAANPHLLSQLVDHRLVPFQPDREAVPREELNESQLAAFQSALTVPDVLLVQGPPGTGKTRTIAQVAYAIAERRERLLLCSHTNRAVDNVLTKLADDLLVVRLGNEESMTDQARRLTVDMQVGRVQGEVLSRTEGAMSRLLPYLSVPSPAALVVELLASQLGKAKTADEAVGQCAALTAKEYTRAIAPISAELSAAERLDQRARGRVAAANDQWLMRERQAASAQSASGPLASVVWRLLTPLLVRRVAAAKHTLEAAQAAQHRSGSHLERMRLEANRLASADGRYKGAENALGVAERSLARIQADMADSLDKVRAVLRPVARLDVETPTSLDEWSALRDRVATAVRLATARAQLLADWRERVPSIGEAMHRELVRYADVVAATCIGTATSPLLAGLEFDVAIVDEAGQVSAPSLLVPLVRSKRAVLVGDHQQLPPFLDSEVQAWADGLGSKVPKATVDRIQALLRQSTFESLFERVDPSHRVMLTEQRRMPPAVAECVSQLFYAAKLTTVHRGWIADPIFRSALGLIDTGDRRDNDRWERAPEQRSGGDGLFGYRNGLEAEIIAALIARSGKHYEDWAVIVPYRAQAELIAELLRRRLGDPGVSEHVNTVDSFQGGERDLVVYGFTRSNARRDIGFLREQRRFNVAISRARQQLVMVGDLRMLASARDRAFAEMMSKMLAYVEAHGDRRPSLTIEGLLG